MLVALAICVVSCTTSDPGAPLTSNDDFYDFPDTLGAHVQIATDAELAAAPLWTVDSAPVLRMSRDAADSAGGRLTRAIFTPPGLLMGFTEGEPGVKVLNARGELVRMWGISDTSADELRRPAWLGLCDGRVYVYNRSKREVRVFDLNGTYRHSFAPLLTSSAGDAFPPHPSQPLLCNTAGDIVALAPVNGLAAVNPLEAADVELGPYRPASLIGIGSAEEPFTTLMTVPGEDRYRYKTGTGPLHEFGRRLSYAISETHLFVATGDAYAIAAYSLRDRAWTVLRVPDRARMPIAATEIEDVKRTALGATNLTDRTRDKLRETLDGMTWPTHHPVITELLTDSAGCLWVQDARRLESSARWAVMTPSGQVLGRLALPSHWHLLQVTDSSLLVRSPSGADRGIAMYRYARPATHEC